VGGGAVGAAATAHWLGSQSTAQSAPSGPAAPQPISAQAAPNGNIAGQVFDKVNPSVVQIVVSGQAQGGPMRSGAGSGFVVDASGLILTNNHVVEGARAITVRFSNGVTREAQVLGTDRGNDLALLKVDLPEGVPVATLGDSDQVQIGETAIAIGSPFGLDQTITQGIVSATHRTWAPGSGRVRRDLIQTDTPLNPGNSGGPLLNARGEVIGINSMIESPVRGSVGVGFAVPINLAKRLLPQLEAGARLEPVWLGISGQQLDATIARDQGLSVQSGVLVTSVVPDGPAARAGLRGGQGAGERIPRGGAVTDVTQITDRLNGRKPGETIQLTIVRDGREQKVTVTLAPWPAEAG
jgi:putative serine protease PepD